MTWKISPFVRRICTRLLAIVPAVIATAIGGDDASNSLLIMSQVILTYALPFAVFPLVHMTSDPKRMGVHVNARWVTVLAYSMAILIVILNIALFL